MSLNASHVSWSTDGTVIVDRVSLQIEPGSTVGLLGPNGSGKSSLLRLLAGLRRPTDGAVLIDGANIAGWGRRDLARRIAVVEQEVATEVDLTVAEVVTLGRTPHRSSCSAITDGDRAAISRALRSTGLDGFVDRRWHSLSGGERQRTQIARALAQEPSELLLDEPTNHLDIAHQLALLDLVRRLPVTGVVALHDLNLAAAFCDKLLVLERGRAISAGGPADVLTENLIHRVYGIRSEITFDASERPHIRYVAESAPDVSATFPA